MKFLKLLLGLIVVGTGYVWFQKSYNLPTYDQFISRHIATANHMLTFNQRGDVDFVIAGDSTGLHNIQPVTLQQKADNLCLSGASTLDTYHVLKKIDLKKVKKGIILATSFNSNSHYDKHLWERFISTDFYSWSELWDIYQTSKESGTFPSNEHSLPVYLGKVFKSKYLLFPEAVRSFFSFPARFLGKKKLILFFQNAVSINRGYVPHPVEYPIAPELFHETYESFYSRPFVMDPTDLLYLKKILEMARSNALQVYLLSPILADKAEKKNVEAFKSSFVQFFSKFAHENPGFQLVMMPTADHLSYFFDFNHLNQKGADYLAPQISAIINKLGQESK